MHVPGWADAEEVVKGFAARPGVAFTALWFNADGLNRALAFRDKLTLRGSVSLSASEAFSLKNLNRDRPGQIEAQRKVLAGHRTAGVPVRRLSVMAAFGCNYSGDIAPSLVARTVADGMAIAADAGVTIERIAWPIPWAGRRRRA